MSGKKSCKTRKPDCYVVVTIDWIKNTKKEISMHYPDEKDADAYLEELKKSNPCWYPAKQHVNVIVMTLAQFDQMNLTNVSCNVKRGNNV